LNSRNQSCAQHAEFCIAISTITWTAQGYGSEALKLVKEFFFKPLQLKSLGLTVFGHNLGGSRA